MENINRFVQEQENFQRVWSIEKFQIWIQSDSKLTISTFSFHNNSNNNNNSNKKPQKVFWSVEAKVWSVTLKKDSVVFFKFDANKVLFCIGKNFSINA